MKAYHQFVSGAARVIRDTIQGGTNNSDIDYDVDQMIHFEIELAKVWTLNSDDSQQSTSIKKSIHFKWIHVNKCM